MNISILLKPDDYRSNMDDDHDLVADINSDTFIRILKFLKRGKASGTDNIHNEVLIVCSMGFGRVLSQ